RMMTASETAERTHDEKTEACLAIASVVFTEFHRSGKMGFCRFVERIMAGDWIKIEHGLSSKPEVMQLADFLQTTEDEV
ncbi:hypothetical protein M3M33_17310, partial [Loigolactobacillus coryniformis]|uniref:hypothetical protein n=1 Tax=Loigolactobacillus coryniformis TaxID=1610 RepID=UPI00201ACFB7